MATAGRDRPEIAAAILRPFVSEAHHWMVLHSTMLGYYYLQHAGLDPNVRDRYRASPYFDLTADFETSTRPGSIRAIARCRSSTSSRCCAACWRSRG